jgi:Tol biopolymer transport system component/tRNA A-37 threonylcarbamoyl transferase component Bud32
VEKRIGHYDVVDLIGRGGMGEVYRARDTVLDRDVALKLLPADLVDDSDRLARLRREAKVLASLQHQNIAAIYGVEETEGSPVLIMELAEGEDLSERMAAGPISPDEAENIARQMARGLEVAHEQGIVHRDLKPANIKIGPDGSVKILDFGLARAFSPDTTSGVREPASDMPTITQALTGAGSVLGTTAYMSPEQARGYEVDRRSDIWAFGVILYEMLAGARLFEGQTTSDVMAAVLRHEPDWDGLADTVPPHLVQICSRCLVKDPRQRLRDIGEARIALGGGSNTFIGSPVEPAPAAAAPAAPNRRGWAVSALLGAALIATAALGLNGTLGPDPEPPAMVRASVATPDYVGLHLTATAPGPVAVSPDGRSLAFTGQDSTGHALLYIRHLDEPEAKPISGTRDAAYPFWSPDSRSLGFFSAGELRRVDVSGGPIMTVCKGENPKGGSWNADDQIIFAPSHASTIHIVSANGGEPEPVTGFDASKRDRSHRFPEWLPGGRDFIYLAVTSSSGSAVNEDSELRLVERDEGVDRVLAVCQTNADYADGQILYVYDDILMARPFSTDDLDFTGPAVPLTSGITNIQGAHLGVFSASSTGVLCYAPAGRTFDHASLLWLSRDGELSDLDPTAKITLGFDVSPDGEHVVMSMIDDATGTADLWLLEIARDLRTRLTFAGEVEMWPLWSPDGLWIAYSGDGERRSQVYRQLVSGMGGPEKLTDSPHDIYPSSWSRDGRYIACTHADSTGNFGIAVLDLSDGSLSTFRNSEYWEAQPSFSPDGRWIAYVSNETSEPEIFVESIEPGAGRWRVSTNGGVSPLWSPEGDRIMYITTSGRVLATDVAAAGEGLRFGETTQLDSGAFIDPVRNFAVNHATGDMLVVHTAPQDQSNAMQLVTRWQDLLER